MNRLEIIFDPNAAKQIRQEKLSSIIFSETTIKVGQVWEVVGPPSWTSGTFRIDNINEYYSFDFTWLTGGWNPDFNPRTDGFDVNGCLRNFTSFRLIKEE